MFCKFEDKYSSTAVWPDNIPFPMPIADDGNCHFEIETRGMWHVVCKVRALAVEKSENGIEVIGPRSLENPRESGHVHEGRVSVGGCKRRAFTSGQMFLVKGKLVDVAILYVCKKG